MLEAAHKHSAWHFDEISDSAICGCFYCRRTYPAGDVKDWMTEADGGRTALCPHCGVDSVIGSASGYEVGDVTFLRAMHARWF